MPFAVAMTPTFRPRRLAERSGSPNGSKYATSNGSRSSRLSWMTEQLVRPLRETGDSSHSLLGQSPGLAVARKEGIILSVTTA